MRRREARHNLQRLLDRVRDRYGARAVLWGVCADPQGPLGVAADDEAAADNAATNTMT